MQIVPKTAQGRRYSEDAPVIASAEEEFRPLELRDRVVIMSLFYEIAREEHVKQSWSRWQQGLRQGSDDPLWRVLVQHPKVDREAIFEVAAQIYGFQGADMIKMRALALLRDLSQTFTTEQWERMISLLVVPVGVGEDPRTGHARLIFATHDPTRPEVHRLLQSLKLDSFDLKYASPSALTDLLKEAFQDLDANTTLLAEHQAAHHRFEDELDQEMINPGLSTQPSKAAELDHSSLVDWFESVLIATYSQGASEAHIFLNASRELEIHLLINDQLHLWRKEATLHPEGFLAYIMDDVIKVDHFEQNMAMETRFQRWINSDLTRFHLSMVPAPYTDDLKAVKVVIRVLGHRESSEKGMGPWKSY